MDIFKPAFRIGAFVMALWGIFMLIPLAVTHGQTQEIDDFLLSAGCCFLLALLLFWLSRGELPLIKPRALFLVTALNWLLLCATGALPYLFASLDINLANAVFESVSGVTTTGSTTLTGLDQLPHSLLLWRSITQWVGGIGIILVAVAVLPVLRVGGMRLFRTESSEWTHLNDSHIRHIASQIGVVYLGISIICFLVYLGLGMSWFNALNHTFTTLSTGGYSTSDSSFGQFQNPSLMWASAVFMLLAGCPFLLLVASIQKSPLLLFQDKQVRLLLILVAIASLTVSAYRLLVEPGLEPADVLTTSTFNIVSIITTTGYASVDYTLWGSFPILIFGFLTFCGACSGSTSGGIKLFRFQLLAIFMREHILKALHPNAKVARFYHDRIVSEEILVASLAFLFFAAISWVVVSLLLALCGLDSVTALSASLTALMNVGPGFGPIIGPAGNFSTLPDAAKYILSIAMLLGRLEYLALVIIFTRGFWRW
ncbi:MAG: TrkH family potassium uptake protein [Pseudomonadales bacterium]|nr:TrkH family potassium uptake protein [Pseudomonadales bacterium]